MPLSTWHEVLKKEQFYIHFGYDQKLRKESDMYIQMHSLIDRIELFLQKTQN